MGLVMDSSWSITESSYGFEWIREKSSYVAKLGRVAIGSGVQGGSLKDIGEQVRLLSVANVYLKL